jgi:uncharacterized ubiquitin-like protein YukD
MKERIKHTTTITTHHKDELIPLIINLDPKEPKYSNIAMFYIKLLKKQEKTLNHLKLETRHLRYLFDFYIETKPTNIKEQRVFLEKYTQALKDANILNWNTVKVNNRVEIFQRTKNFIDFIVQHKSLSIKNEEHFINTIIEAFNFSKKIPNSKFFNKFLIQKEINLNNIKHSFPTDKIMTLIEKTSLPKYKLLYSLMAFGGLSSSRCLHLLKGDVKIENNRLRITIGDPENSLINGVKRIEYLKNLGHLPRTKEEGNLNLAWSRPRYQSPEKLESEVIFIGEIETYLIELHNEYISSRKDDNPFYFITKNQAMIDQRLNVKFKKDCELIGLNPKDEGVSFNGLRNFYGHYLVKVLQLDKLYVQRLMNYNRCIHAESFLIDKRDNFKQVQIIQEST